MAISPGNLSGQPSRTFDARAASRGVVGLASHDFLVLAPEESIGTLMEALDVCREGQDLWGEAEVRRMLGLWHSDFGDDDRAVAHDARAVELFDEVGDLHKAADARFNLSQLLDFPDDVMALNTACKSYEALALSSDAADCWLGLSIIDRSQDDLPTACEKAEVAIDLFTRDGAWDGVVRASSWLCKLLWECDEVDRARTVLSRTSELLDRIAGSTLPAIYARARLGGLLLEFGMPSEALPHLRLASHELEIWGYDEEVGVELHRSWREEQWSELVGGTLVQLAEALVMVGEVQEGWEATQHALGWCQAHEVDAELRLGLVTSMYFISCGQFDRAEGVLLPLHASLEQLPEEDRGSAFDRLMGAVENNLANVSWSRDDLDEALARLASASSRFHRPEDEEVRLTVEYQRALVVVDQGEWESACQMLEQVSTALESMGAEARSAQVHLVRASILDDVGAREASLSAAEKASAMASELGMMYVWAAADALIAWQRALLAESVDALSDQRVAELLDELIPAALALGALRLRLRDAPARANLAVAFEDALGRAAMIALEGSDNSIVCELAETARLFGVVSRSGRGELDQDQGVPGLLGKVERPVGAARGRDLATHLVAPPSILADDAADLALSAPPMLDLPWGVVALERFHDMAKKRYGVRLASDRHVSLAATL